MVAAGRMDSVVMILQRVATPVTPGVARGGFVDLARVWGSYESGNSIRVAFGEFRANVSYGQLTVRADPVTEALVAGARLTIDGRAFTVRDARLPDRRTGNLVLEVMSTQGADLYATQIDNEGEVVTVRRLVPGASPIEIIARAKVAGYDAKALVSGIKQGDRNILLLASDVDGSEFPLPLQQTDRIVVRGASLSMRSLDDSTHRFAGVLYAYEIVAGG